MTDLSAKLIEYTSALVDIPSENPPGNERGVADAARQLIEPLGATFTEVEDVVNRVSLLANLEDFSPDRPTLIINGHIDVVPADIKRWNTNPFVAQVDLGVGRLYGRGTTDMKGGIAAALVALSELKTAGADLAWNVALHLVADEERGGGLGTALLVKHGLIQGDVCLVPEPTDLDLCIAERGVVAFNVNVSGVPAHASQPSLGVSAIGNAAKIVSQIQGMMFPASSHPLLGITSCNVGLISGGSGTNVVAEACTFSIDRRVLPGQNAHTIFAEMRQIIDSLDIDRLSYEFSPIIEAEASELSPDDPWVGVINDACIAAGLDPRVIGMSFTTDARFMRNDLSIPTVVLGPGSIAQAHVDNEYVELSALEKSVELFKNVLTNTQSAQLVVKHQL